ncbi:hypothetical protein OIU35_32225 [Boseaceae bacterium BT-24-1]|nr:hypothetical protein [Boseaceae bacterium BT-24-1]
MSAHILVCSPVSLPLRDTVTGLLVERESYSIWLRELPKDDTYYSELRKAFSRWPTWSFFYAVTDSAFGLHLDLLPEWLVADAGVADELSDDAFGAFAHGLVDVTAEWPTPYVLYISDNPQPVEENLLSVTRSKLAAAIKSQTDSIFLLPDVLIEVSS